MPITQDRMIGLIEVAIEYSNLVEELQQLISTSLARKRTNPDVAPTEIETLAAVALTLRPSMQSIRLLAKEEAHFTSMRAHNDRAKSYMENKRRDGGTPRRWPSEDQVRHRVDANVSRFSGDRYMGKTTAEWDALIATQNIEADEKARQEALAKKRAEEATATPPKIDPSIPMHENPALYREHDAEAVEIKEVWDSEGTIIGGEE